MLLPCIVQAICAWTKFLSGLMFQAYQSIVFNHHQHNWNCTSHLYFISVIFTFILSTLYCNNVFCYIVSQTSVSLLEFLCFQRIFSSFLCRRCCWYEFFYWDGSGSMKMEVLKKFCVDSSLVFGIALKGAKILAIKSKTKCVNPFLFLCNF